MNYLELVQDVCDDSMVVPVTPSSVSGLTGMAKRIANWVSREWVTIQNSCQEYDFRQSTQQHTLAAGIDTYSLATLGINSWSRWRGQTALIYKNSDGASAERRLLSVTHDEMVQLKKGVCANAAPQYFAWDHLGELTFFPTPDTQYTFTCGYTLAPVILTEDTDVPACHVSHHPMIAAKALIKFAIANNAPEVLSLAKDDYDTMFNRFELDHKPQISMGVHPLTSGVSTYGQSW